MPTKKPPPRKPAPKQPDNVTSIRRAGRRTKLTINPDIAHTIADTIRRGAFDHVAAQAAGVAPNTFHEWCARGEGRDPDRPTTPEFAEFAKLIAQARADARARAETRVFDENPLAWLRMGPGRHRDDNAPGWTDKTELAVTGTMGPSEIVVTFVDDWRAGADPDG